MPCMPDPTPLLERARQRFITDEHLVDVLAGEWITMVDDHGRPLDGIRGRPGALGTTIEGHRIGADLVEMQPGSMFPLHVHPGDHILYGISGAGNVLIERERRLMYPGVTCFAAAEFEHGVGTYRTAEDLPVDQRGYTIALNAWLETSGVFRLLAIGVPHKHVGSHDRMRIIDEARNVNRGSLDPRRD